MKYNNRFQFPCGCIYESGGRQLFASPNCNVRNHTYPTSLEGLAERIDKIEDVLRSMGLEKE